MLPEIHVGDTVHVKPPPGFGREYTGKVTYVNEANESIEVSIDGAIKVVANIGWVKEVQS
jgi:hypothetical protein